MNKSIKGKKELNGTITVPGDKSISHRAVMLGSIAQGTTYIKGFLTGEDCLSTISCFRKMGIDICVSSTNVTVNGKGMRGLVSPTETLDVGNSGTTLRLISGLLAAQNFTCNITGDSSIQKRPMDRVSVPLGIMGAKISGVVKNSKLYAPIKIEGTALSAMEYTLPIASAQVKSAIILASLYAEKETVITEPEATRDHTEIMLNYLGANIEHHGNKITCHPIKELYAKKIYVPGDISSAAYFMVAAAICENSCITIKNVGVNPTRTGIITVLRSMGANIIIEGEKTICGEAVADITVSSSSLHGTVVGGIIIPTLIDEIPVIAVAAAFAEGKTIIKNAEELKVKESNRIHTVVSELTNLGIEIEETNDGMIISGSSKITGGICESHNDHRIAMSLAVAALKADNTTICNAECIDISFPNFFKILERL